MAVNFKFVVHNANRRIFARQFEHFLPKGNYSYSAPLPPTTGTVFTVYTGWSISRWCTPSHDYLATGSHSLYALCITVLHKCPLFPTTNPPSAHTGKGKGCFFLCHVLFPVSSLPERRSSPTKSKNTQSGIGSGERTPKFRIKSPKNRALPICDSFGNLHVSLCLGGFRIGNNFLLFYEKLFQIILLAPVFCPVSIGCVKCSQKNYRNGHSKSIFIG